MEEGKVRYLIPFSSINKQKIKCGGRLPLDEEHVEYVDYLRLAYEQFLMKINPKEKLLYRGLKTVFILLRTYDNCGWYAKAKKISLLFVGPIDH